MSSIFPPRLIKYNFQTQSDFFKHSVNSNKYGLNSIRFLQGLANGSNGNEKFEEP